MLGIIKKDSLLFLMYSLIITGGLGFYLVSVNRPLDPAITGLASLYLFLAVSGSVIVTEQKESKSRGYVFLRTLPVTDREIVGAKYVLNLFNILVSSGVLLLSVTRIPSDDRQLSILGVCLGVSVLAAWMTSGFWYWGIYSLGITRMSKVVWGFVLSVIFAGLIFIEFAVYRNMLDVGVLAEILINIDWKIWVVMYLCGLSLYVQMYRLSLNAFRLKNS